MPNDVTVTVTVNDPLVELNIEAPQGSVGPTGPQGDSAYDVAVENGFIGTEAEWLASLVGGTVNVQNDYVAFICPDGSTRYAQLLNQIP